MSIYLYCYYSAGKLFCDRIVSAFHLNLNDYTRFKAIKSSLNHLSPTIVWNSTCYYLESRP